MDASQIGPWVALGSLVVSITTLVLAALVLRSKANGKQVESLEHRVERLERELEACKNENLRLMKLLLKEENV